MFCARGVGNVMPSNTIYGIDPEGLEVRYMADYNMVPLFPGDGAMPVNQDAYAQYLLSVGELVLKNPAIAGASSRRRPRNDRRSVAWLSTTFTALLRSSGRRWWTMRLPSGSPRRPPSAPPSPARPTATPVNVSYALGNPEKGTDGHVYVMVRAGAALDASDGVAIDENTWVATLDESSPVFEVPADIEGGSVANGEYFHARRILL